MTITSIGYAGSIGWAAWAQMARDLGTDYGIDGVDDLKVVIKAAAAGEITVAAGTAHGQGIIDTSDSTITLAGLTATNTWYTIVVRRDWTGGPGAEVTTILALAGNAAKAIASARQVGAGVIDDQPIALVHRGSTLDQVVDLRCWWGNGGLYAASVDALAYLGRPGSEVRVGASTFSRRLGAQWVELPDSIHADRVTDGVLNPARIPNLDAAKITGGVLNAAQIPPLPASRINDGVLAAARIPDLDAAKITAGVLAAARLPAHSASLLTSGWLHNDRLLNVAGGSGWARLGPPGAIASDDTFGTGASAGLNFRVTGGQNIGIYAGAKQLFGIEGRAADATGAYATIQALGIYKHTTSAAANVAVSSGGVLRRSTSSRRYKTDIAPAPRTPSILDVEPRTWVDKAEAGREQAKAPTHRHYGAIAEDLHDLGLTHLVTYDDQGRPDAISYPLVAISLIPEVRALADTVAAQAAQIAALTAAVEALGGPLPTPTQED